MIRENQRLLNHLNVLSDALILYSALPAAFWIRFYLLPGGIISIPVEIWLLLALPLALCHITVCAAFGLYRSHRRASLTRELTRLWLANAIVVALLLSVLFLGRNIDFSRVALGIYFVLGGTLLSAKRILLRLVLRHARRAGYNQKHLLLLGSGKIAASCLNAIRTQRELGYSVLGNVAENAASPLPDVEFLGSFSSLKEILKNKQPDEVICALEAREDHYIPEIIAECERAGVKLSIIPSYAAYITSVPQFDSIGDLPLLNIRHISLDNWGNAFLKRLVDILGSLVLILVTSPIMLVCTIGVRLSSPGPVIFRQERVGRGNKPFFMYKFRSMYVNNSETTGWSHDRDDRKTAFGALMRKYSLDELPQFFNVLWGDMSLVGPRPEIPHFVNQFREEIPLYMVKHQVRPGITGWAQVHDLRGDTSIRDRIEHDIWYIEHWSIWLDVKILLTTVFKGKFKNSEKLR